MSYPSHEVYNAVRSTVNIVYKAATSTVIEACVAMWKNCRRYCHGPLEPFRSDSVDVPAITAIGALPALEESVSWLPVNICVQAVIQLSGLTTNSADRMIGSFRFQNPSEVFHVPIPATISWTGGVLPALAKSGLSLRL